MRFNNKDLFFFDTILSFERIIEKKHDKIFDINFNKKNLKYIKKGKIPVNINNKKEIKNFFHIGTYNEDNEIFTWNIVSREMLSDQFKDASMIKLCNIYNNFESTFFKLITNQQINLKKKYMNIIPYLYRICMGRSTTLYKLTTDENPEETIYFSIELDYDETLESYLKREFITKLEKINLKNNLSRLKKSSKKPSKKTSKKSK